MHCGSHRRKSWFSPMLSCKFSVSQIGYPLGGSSKKGSHVYFLLQVFWVILLFDINVVLMLPCWPDVTIVQSDATIVVPWQLSTGSKHNYLFCYCPLVGILFEVLRIESCEFAMQMAPNSPLTKGQHTVILYIMTELDLR